MSIFLLLAVDAPGIAQSFSSVSAGDMDSTSVVLWTQIRNGDGSQQMLASATLLKIEVSTDINFSNIVHTYDGATIPENGNTFKLGVSGLEANTQYYYRFTALGGDQSDVGTFFTTPETDKVIPFKFAFTGDYDETRRPYSVLDRFGTAANPGSVGVHYFINLGDLIYEKDAAGSPALPKDPEAKPQSLNQFYRKYIESQTGVVASSDPAVNGQMSTALALQQGNKQMLTSVGVYSVLDNHELYGKYISGGAPINSVKENLLCSDTGHVQPCLESASNNGPDYINQTESFRTMQKAFYNTQATIAQTNGLNLNGISVGSPIIHAPNDPRTNGTIQNFFSRSWGKAAQYIQLDDRSYRDARMVRTDPLIADDPARTMLGMTQLEWFKQELAVAEKSGAVWKIVAISTPIEQWDATGDPDDPDNDNKAWIGGYNAERNELLKFIADKKISNVIFITTDDHVARATKLNYQPAGPNSGSSEGWSEVPGAFQLLAGPAGAGGPYERKKEYEALAGSALSDFAVSQAVVIGQDKELADKGAPKIGLMGLPGLNNIYREGHADAAVSPQGADFVSATTFSYSTVAFDRFANLSVEYLGIDAYPANSYPSSCAMSGSTSNCTAAPRLLFGFSVDVPYAIGLGEGVSLTDADRHQFTGRDRDPLFFNSKWTNRGVLDISGTSVGATFANYQGDGALVLGAHTPLKVNERATIEGGAVIANVTTDGAFELPKAQWTVLQADGGRTGTFSNAVIGQNLAFLTPMLAYSATDVMLSFALTPFSAVASTINQRNVGNALTIGAFGPISGPGANVLNTLFYGSYQSARSVLDTVGGAGLAGVQTTAMEVGQMFSATVSDQVAFWRSGETNDLTGVTLHESGREGGARSFLAYAPTETGITTRTPITVKGPVASLVTPLAPARTFRAWGAMFGGGANFLSGAGRGAPSATAGYYGGLLGVDYQVTPNALIGVSLGGSNAGFNVGSLSTNGSLTGFHAGVYGAYATGASYLALSETFSAYSNQTKRSAGGDSFLPYENLSASFGSTEFRTRLEGGHSLFMGGLKATPFVAAEIAAYTANSFSERSSLLYQSPLALKNNGHAINSLPTFVGLRLSNAYTLENGWRLAPIGSLAYVHEFFPQRQFTNILMSMPGQDFNVAGPRSTYNLVQTKLGAHLFLNKVFALYSDFQGEFSPMSQSYGGTAGMKYYW